MKTESGHFTVAIVNDSFAKSLDFLTVLIKVSWVENLLQQASSDRHLCLCICSCVSNSFHSSLLCIKVLNPISVLEKGYLLRKELSLSCDTEPHLLLSSLEFFHLRLHILNCV